MFKESKFINLEKKYNLHLYTGFVGKMMKKSHEILIKTNPHESYQNKILEIGPGTMPHYNFMKNKIFKKYVAINIDQNYSLTKFYAKNIIKSFLKDIMEKYYLKS